MSFLRRLKHLIKASTPSSNSSSVGSGSSSKQSKPQQQASAQQQQHPEDQEEQVVGPSQLPASDQAPQKMEHLATLEQRHHREVDEDEDDDDADERQRRRAQRQTAQNGSRQSIPPQTQQASQPSSVSGGTNGNSKERRPSIEAKRLSSALKGSPVDEQQPGSQEQQPPSLSGSKQLLLPGGEDEDDEFDIEFADEDDEQRSHRVHFQTLSPEQIVEQQQREIQNVADLLNVSPEDATILLRHFSWQKEQLLSRYFEHSERVRKEAGLVSSSATNSSSTSTGGAPLMPTPERRGLPIQKSSGKAEEPATPGSPVSHPIQLHGTQVCSICSDDMPPEECTALGCQHPFCNDCWDVYLTQKITEGETKIRCPHHKCTAVVGERTIKKLVGSDVYDRYIRFLVKTFVDDSAGRIKWCPQAGCGNAITADMIKGTVVRCGCGFRFCFQCHREAHQPASCDQVREWERKCQDDSETTHWKYANTKDCPKCQCPVEKNGGCNHMVCLKCKHEWCWVCLRPFKGHNDFYNCNKFVKDLGAPARRPSFLSTLFRGSNARDKAREREQQRERNRLALERYLHYFHRYQNHSHSGELEKQIRGKALSRVAELQKEASTSSELQYIVDGTDVLLQCRNVLKYTYVFAYYEFEQGPPARRHLFEYLQEDLEKTTEQLSELLEGNTLDRLKTLNMIQLAETRRNNITKACAQGLAE